jgi:hypothetical protein
MFEKSADTSGTRSRPSSFTQDISLPRGSAASVDRAQVTLREEGNAFTKEFVDATRDIYVDVYGEVCTR